ERRYYLARRLRGSHMLASTVGAWLRRRRCNGRSFTRRARRPRLEVLEDRLAPAAGQAFVLDMAHQPDGNDGRPDSIVVRQTDHFLEVRAGAPGAETVRLRDQVDQVASLRILGSNDDDTLQIPATVTTPL